MFLKKSKRIPNKVRYLLDFQCVENCSFYKNGTFFKEVADNQYLKMEHLTVFNIK